MQMDRTGGTMQEIKSGMDSAGRNRIEKYRTQKAGAEEGRIEGGCSGKSITAKSRMWFMLFLLVWCLQMLTALYFCCQKKGFHEDEFYTYYSTARTYGLAIEDGAWMEHDDYYREFAVQEGEGFRYGLVKQVQSWDVHPPVYYWVFHTICSLFPGQFSKWFGLVINLAAFGVSLFLLRILALKVSGRREGLAWLVCLFYGFTPAVMSSVVFIRMYALLTVFVYLCAILHIGALEKKKTDTKLPFWKFLLPLAVVTYLGFLTQYYYFIFLFFMGAAFCLYLLWKEKKLGNCIRYACSMAVSFLLAYLTYPAFPGQMFRGQRGAQATNSFFDLSNTWMRLSFFWNLLDEYVFGKMLPVLLLAVCCLFLFYRRVCGRTGAGSESEKSGSGDMQKRDGAFVGKNAAFWLLSAAAAGYFLAVSKTALLLGNTSVRYQAPVYGIIVLLLFEAVADLGTVCLEAAGRKAAGRSISEERLLMKNSKSAGTSSKKAAGLGIVAAALLCLAVDGAGLLSGRVVFLYPEAEAQCAFAEDAAERNVPVVCLYDVGQSWCVWDCADEFFAYERIYFAGLDDAAPIADETLAVCEELVVYLCNTAEKDEQMRRIQSCNPRLTECELQYQGKYYDVYRMRADH